LDQLLDELPAISIDGPKGVGKTETAGRRAATRYDLDSAAHRELVRADPGLLAPNGPTVLLDEWQHLPEVWDVVRRAVDAGADAGRFLLAGSAAPTSTSTHSGAGRIVSLRMRPMALSERGLVKPTVSLSTLIAGERAPVSGESPLTAVQYAEEIVRSGFPGIRGGSMRAVIAQLDGYLARIVEHDFAGQGRPVRRPATLLAWLRAYAAATATTAAYNAILDAATPGEGDKPAKTTTIAYRDVLTSLWLLDPVPAWLPTDNPFSRLGAAPKHHLADPALAARLLDLDVDTLRTPLTIGPANGSALGTLFESLVTLSVRSYAQAIGGVGHLCTRDGDHEVDLIVEGRAGRVIAFEVELAGSVGDADVRQLRWLRTKLGTRLLDSAVLTTGSNAYRCDDGIAVIPAALLGP
jgi:predicted AAA+ superfamily ATPase